MSIDSLGRASAAAARTKATQEVDTTMMLEKLQRTHRTRTVAMAVAGIAAAATGIVLVVHGVTGTSSGQAPGGQVSSGPSQHSPSCPEGTTCLGGSRYRVALTVPVTVDLPDTFQGAFRQFGAAGLEDYRKDVDQSGVTLMENAHALKDDANYTDDPSGGTTAQSMATWFTHRPFLVHATMTRTTVGGRPAWTVTGDLKPGASLPATKAGGPAVPTFGNGTATAAYGPTLTGEYTLLDVPGAGVTVIWTWTPPATKDALAESQAYVEGLSFG